MRRGQAQRDGFRRSNERKFSWDNVEIDLIRDEKNNLKRVEPMPIARQESVRVRPRSGKRIKFKRTEQRNSHLLLMHLELLREQAGKYALELMEIYQGQARGSGSVIGGRGTVEKVKIASSLRSSQ